MGRVSAKPRSVATHLEAVLQCRGRKQGWLVAHLGVSAAAVSLLVAGARTVDRATGERIAALLGVPFFALHARQTERSLVIGRG